MDIWTMDVFLDVEYLFLEVATKIFETHVHPREENDCTLQKKPQQQILAHLFLIIHVTKSGKERRWPLVALLLHFVGYLDVIQEPT